MALGPKEIIELYKSIKLAEGLVDAALASQGGPLTANPVQIKVELNLDLAKEAIDALCAMYVEAGWTEVTSAHCLPPSDKKWELTFLFIK